MNDLKLFGRYERMRRHDGFTLIELMIAMMLGIFLIGAVILTYLSSRSAASDAEQISRMQANVRFAVEYMIRDFRNAGYADELGSLIYDRAYVRGEMATIGANNDSLTVRYLGRGHCTDVFNEVRIVENEYSVNEQLGQLVCQGRYVDPTTGTFVASGSAIALLNGVNGLRFDYICPDGTTTCACALGDTDASVANSCIGITARLDFQALRAGTGFDIRSIQFQTAFRNVILERMRRGIPPAPS